MFYISGISPGTVPTHREEHEELLVVLADAVVDPGTVVVHLANAPLTDGAVVGAIWLDAPTFRTLSSRQWTCEAAV